MKQLSESLSPVACLLASDPRWEEQRDDLNVAVVGMLLFGFAFMVGRTILLMEPEEIGSCVVQILVDKLGVAKNWAEGLVEEAQLSIFDRKYHPGNHELIGVGHQYFGESPEVIVDNIFANIKSVGLAKRGAGGN